MRGLGLATWCDGVRVRRGRCFAISTALVLVFAACGGDDDGGTPDASPDAAFLTDCDQLQQELQEYADASLTFSGIRVAAVMMGVDTPACGVRVATGGLANVDPETPMTPEHMLHIGSICKTFVATRVLQLVEEGELSLDDTLSKWRTDIPNAESITVRQLLNHTSGVPDFVNFESACWHNVESFPSREWSIEGILDCVDGLAPTSAPGEEWHYSNTNYVLLGHIVERVTENPLHEEVRSSLLSPLGLDHTFTLFYEEPPGELAGSYEWDDSGWIDVTDAWGNYSFLYGAGNIASNPGDLLAWVRALFTGTTLQATTLDEMMDCVDEGGDPWATDTFTQDRYGLGIECAHDINAGEIRGHTGWGVTALSQVWYSPSLDSSVVFLVSRGPFETHPDWFYPIASHLFDIVGRSPGFY